jgi:hypothetical protein
MGTHKVAVSRRNRVLDMAGTTLGFAVVLATLVALDPRVTEQVTRTVSPDPTAKLLSWGQRLVELLRVMADVAREQGADNGAMLVLLLIGLVLTVFMVRT